jgi:periplasmic glucans biosynthesis protein
MLRRTPLIAGLLGVLALAGLHAGFSEGRDPAPDTGAETPWSELQAPPSSEAVGRDVADWMATAGMERPPLPPLLVERARWRELEGAVLPATVDNLLAGLSYDEYRDIEFRRDASLWKDDGPFRLQFFHPGSIHTEQVRIHRVDGDAVAPVSFEPGLFEYRGHTTLERRLRGAELDFAGFRVNHPLNAPGVWDEVAVFLGASYFRLLARGHVYGISGRGVAVNTTLIGAEEFPGFREFWVVRPPDDGEGLHIFARLDGASVTGAYHFHLKPGSPTVMEVATHLFVHGRVEELGIAPLTSMFLTAPSTGPPVDDFRPRIHDSDGLLVHTAEGEWIWRPLSNGPGLRITSEEAANPRGFGLVQRNRDFGAYLDLEARYHDRPSLWVEVLDEAWGAGAVRLLELPTTSEFEDNIVAFWAPEGGAAAGDEFRLRYRLVAFDDRLEAQTLAQVAETRIGSAQLPGASPSPLDRARRFVVDFHHDSPRISDPAPAQAPSLEGVEVLYRASSGRVSDVRAELLPGGAGWRATFVLEPRGDEGSDLRLALRRDGVPLTETWSYHWQPRPPESE